MRSKLLQRGQPVRNGDHRAPVHQPVERRLDRPLALAVQRAGRLIQQQDRRVLQQRARDRQALALAARQLDAAIADDGGEAFRHRLDEVAAVRHLGRRQHLRLGRLGPRVADVLQHRAVEQADVLRHDRHGLAQAVLGHVANVLAVDQDAAALRRRRSAAAAPARWTCRRRKSPPARRAGPARSSRSKSRSTGGAVRVGEAHMLEVDPARGRGAAASRRAGPAARAAPAARRSLPPAARRAASGRPAPPPGRACCAGCRWPSAVTSTMSPTEARPCCHSRIAQRDHARRSASRSAPRGSAAAFPDRAGCAGGRAISSAIVAPMRRCSRKRRAERAHHAHIADHVHQLAVHPGGACRHSRDAAACRAAPAR